MRKKMNPSFFVSLSFYYSCRYGAPSGHPKAHTRASSQILTVRPDSESSAPSPIHANSQSTLAAKQTLPWTLNTSVSSGDASLLSPVCQRGVKWTFWENRLTKSLRMGNPRTTETPIALSLLIRLLNRTQCACSVWRIAIFSASPQGLLV